MSGLSSIGLFGDFNDANVLFLGGLPKGVIWGLAAVGLLVLIFSFFDLKELRGKRRFMLMSLRAIVLLIALAMLLEPALELRNVTKIRNHVVFLVDSSMSMQLAQGTRETGVAESRWDAASEFLAGARELLETSNEDHQFEILRFDRSVEATTLDGVVSGPGPSGDATLLLEAIEEVSARYPRQELGGIVIISDGTDSGVLSGRVREGETLDADTAAFIEGLEVPIHSLALGDVNAVQDIAIERVLVDDFAFVRNRVTIEVMVRAIGYHQGRVAVTLRRQGEVLQTREVVLQQGVTDYRITFEFIPEQIGKEIYSVSVPFLRGDQLAENNSAYFILKVIRDKIRVLQVCGRPSWDERFLREFLKQNPNVDLISFFILRTDSNLQLVPNNELSLIPFPTEELFEEQLGSFDLVIFQNFTYRPYGMYRYLGRIAEYVNNGGAFLMVGGEQAFGSGGYTGTAIADLLPVFLPPEGPDDVIIDETPFRPTLTNAGMHHPITQLEFSPPENVSRWAELPEVRGTNVVMSARSESTVLLEHPSLSAASEPMAVLSVMEVGDGRSMALTVDSTWRWSFGSVGQGGTSRAYTTFWNSAIRWLIQDPELKLIQVEAPQQHVNPGVPFEVSIRVFQSDYQPAADLTGIWELERRPLDALGDDAAMTVVESAEFTTDSRGRATVPLVVDEEGAYELHARLSLDDTGPVEDSDVFLVLRESQEFRNIVPRPDLLRLLSEHSSDDARHADELDPDDLDFADALTVRVNRRRILDVWNSPWLLGAIALLLATEWWLRRRWGRL